MVVRLDLDQDVERLVVAGVDPGRRVGEPAAADRAGEHRGVVAVGREHAFGRLRVGVADHREQRFGLRDAVDDEVGVEDLVPAMLGVGLREHHELDVGRIAAEARESWRTGNRSRRRPAPARGARWPPRARHARRARATWPSGAGRRRREQHRPPRRSCASTPSVMRSCSSAPSAASGAPTRPSKRCWMPRSMRRTKVEPADRGDVGRLARPGRDRARPRHDQQARRRPRRASRRPRARGAARAARAAPRRAARRNRRNRRSATGAPGCRRRGAAVARAGGRAGKPNRPAHPAVSAPTTSWGRCHRPERG